MSDVRNHRRVHRVLFYGQSPAGDDFQFVEYANGRFGITLKGKPLAVPSELDGCIDAFLDLTRLPAPRRLGADADGARHGRPSAVPGDDRRSSPQYPGT